MRRLVVFALALFLAWLFIAWLGISSAKAGGKPSAPAWQGPEWTNVEAYVEQQTPGGCCVLPPERRVFNPDFTDQYLHTGCAWDPDDWQVADFGSGGFIEPGVRYSMEFCIIADWTKHQIGLRLGPGLAGSISVAGFTLDVASIGCVIAPEYRLDQHGTFAGPAYDDGWVFSPLIPRTEIPGSNGGVGIRTTVTVTVWNATTRKIKNPTAQARLVLPGWKPQAELTGCPYPLWDYAETVYPGGHDPQMWWWKQ